jgi:hypothetical protein
MRIFPHHVGETLKQFLLRIVYMTITNPLRPALVRDRPGVVQSRGISFGSVTLREATDTAVSGREKYQ